MILLVANQVTNSFSCQDKAASYSLFFNDLKSRGHILTYLQVESPKLKLKSFGEYSYDNIVFFAPSVDKFSSLSFEDITTFSNEGGNIIIAVNREASDSVRELAESFGVAIDKKGTEVIDHFETVSSFDTRYGITLICSLSFS